MTQHYPKIPHPTEAWAESLHRLEKTLQMPW